jgi:hypothetical protein
VRGILWLGVACSSAATIPVEPRPPSRAHDAAAVAFGDNALFDPIDRRFVIASAMLESIALDGTVAWRIAAPGRSIAWLGGRIAAITGRDATVPVVALVDPATGASVATCVLPIPSTPPATESGLRLFDHDGVSYATWDRVMRMSHGGMRPSPEQLEAEEAETQRSRRCGAARLDVAGGSCRVTVVPGFEMPSCAWQPWMTPPAPSPFPQQPGFHVELESYVLGSRHEFPDDAGNGLRTRLVVRDAGGRLVWTRVLEDRPLNAPP